MIGEDTWVGTFSQGIKVIDKNRQVIKTYKKEEKAHSLNDNSVSLFTGLQQGVYFWALCSGLQRYRPESDDFENIDELTGMFVYDIREDSKGNIWLANVCQRSL